MNTAFGLCPSFHNWTARQILFTNPLRRGRSFEVCHPQTFQPLGRLSELGPDGWPKIDGQKHGVRLFGSMNGLMPILSDGGTYPTLWITSPNARLVGRGVVRRASLEHRNEWDVDPKTLGDSMLLLVWDGGPVSVEPVAWGVPDARLRGFHLPGIMAMRRFTPLVLRTLDWQRTNDRKDWDLPRSTPGTILQGNEMAIEYQCQAANFTGTSLWWCAPPRFDLAPEAYIERLVEYLRVIRETVRRPVVFEYGNELWNAGFAVHNWLKGIDTSRRWYENAAVEISYFWSAIEAVFGPQTPINKGYYTFVGGFIGDPDLTPKIIKLLPHKPDLAGPACYVGAAKSNERVQVPAELDSALWERDGTAPTPQQLDASVQLRLAQVSALLAEHRSRLPVEVMLACYEAGQSFIAGYHPWRDVAIDYQASQECGNLYRSIRRILNANKVALANWYSLATSQTPPKGLDVFGLSAGEGAPDLPKLLAAMGG